MPENQVYGFAVHQFIQNQFESCCSCVSNRPLAKDYDESKPQTIDFYGDHLACVKLPDFYDWQIKVFLSIQDKIFTSKVQKLIRGGEPVNCDDDFAIYFEARELTLRALLHFLKQPKATWPILFQCFEANLEASAEYCFSRDELIDPDSHESY